MIELSPRRNPQSLPAVWCLLIRRACARARPSFWCLLTRCLWTFFHEMGIRGACVRTRAHACGRCIALLRRLFSQSRNFFAALSALCRTPDMGRVRSSEWREPAAVARRLHTSTTSISWSAEAVEAAGATGLPSGPPCERPLPRRGRAVPKL